MNWEADSGQTNAYLDLCASHRGNLKTLEKEIIAKGSFSQNHFLNGTLDGKIEIQSAKCTNCSGKGKIACKHGMTENHWYCSHGKTQKHDT